MFKSLMFVVIAALALTSCKKEKSKAEVFSDGCRFGAAAGLGSLGLPVGPESFRKPCDETAEAYVAGKLDKMLAAPSPEPVASPSPSPSK